MKKLLFLSLILPGYLVAGSSLLKFIDSLLTPISSIDSLGQDKFEMLHRKKNIVGDSYSYADDEELWGATAGDFRRIFPKNDPSSVNRLTKALILERVAKEPTFGLLISSKIDYEALWKAQSLKDRLWWKIRHRRPGIYFLNSAKYLTMAGAIYGVSRLVKEYKKRQAAKLHISTN